MSIGVTDEEGGLSAEVDDGALWIRIDRPDRRNSLNRSMVQAFVEQLEAAAVDDSLRAICISSSGSDFCSGADWVAVNAAGAPRPRTGNLQRRTALQGHRLIELMMSVQLPIVCGVRGWAAGLGYHIALAADFTIASTSARFWEPFGQRGFSPDSGGTWFLPRLVGIARAKELLMLGRELSGEEAAAWGLVHRAVPDDELEASVADLVSRLAAGPTIALGLTKHLVHRSLETPLAEAMEAEAFALELSSRSGDFKEGLQAFQERRTPKFKGR